MCLAYRDLCEIETNCKDGFIESLLVKITGVTVKTAEADGLMDALYQALQDYIFSEPDEFEKFELSLMEDYNNEETEPEEDDDEDD